MGSLSHFLLDTTEASACSHSRGAVHGPLLTPLTYDALNFAYSPVNSQPHKTHNSWNGEPLLRWASQVEIQERPHSPPLLQLYVLPVKTPYDDVNFVTAFVPSDTACFASSPGRMRRTAVWISRDVIVGFLL